MSSGKKSKKSVSKKDVEKQVEKAVKGAADRFGEILGSVIAITISVFGLWIAHNVTSWDHEILDFVKPEFDDLLWLINLSVGTSIAVKVVEIFITNRRVRSFTKIIENVFSFWLCLAFLREFPFDFEELVSIEWLNTAAKVVLGIGLFGVAVSTIVELVKLVLGGEENRK